MARLSLLLGMLVGCADPPPARAPAGGAEADCEATLEWRTAGQPLVASYCAACHSADLPVGAARSDAPEGVDLDTLEGTRQWAGRAIVRMRAGDMPPSGGVTEAELARFETWVACGMPGAPLDRPAAPDWRAATGAADAEEIVEVDEADPSLRLWRVDVATATADLHRGLWSAETWLVDEGGAALVSRARYRGDGATLFTDSWSPPLRLLDLEAEAWEQQAERVRRAADGSEVSRDEAWAVGCSDEVRGDPRQFYDGVRTCLGVEDGGEEEGVGVTLDGLAVERWVHPDADLPDPAFASLERLGVNRPGEPPPPGELFEAGMIVTRLHVEAAP